MILSFRGKVGNCDHGFDPPYGSHQLLMILSFRGKVGNCDDKHSAGFKKVSRCCRPNAKSVSQSFLQTRDRKYGGRQRTIIY